MPYQLTATAAEALIHDLSNDWRVVVGTRDRGEGAYYDTFDWRLRRAGLALFVGREDEGLCWSLRNRQSGDEIQYASGCGEPGLATALPEAFQELAPLLEMRRLLPRVQIEAEQWPLALLNDDEKTVLRLAVLESRAITADGGRTALPLQLTLSPLRGYEDETNRLQGWIKAQPRPEGGTLDAALSAIGAPDDPFLSRPRLPLQPTERAETAARAILRHLLGTLEANLDGVRQDLDTEFLHDLRIALRRTRSALTQLKGVFAPEATERFKAEFAWLGEVTGPLRDLDVYLLQLPAHEARLPVPYRDALAAFRDFLAQQRAEALRHLVEQLASPRCHEVLREWRTFLEGPASDDAAAPQGAVPVKPLADVRIHRLYRRLLKEGEAIGPESPPEALHDLRKRCKKLRYLLEFFQSLYPPAEITALIKTVRRLLDNLGNFQDLQVQAQRLESMASTLRWEPVETRTLMAMGMLIEGLLRRQAAERERFAHLFDQFRQREVRETFAGLFRHAKGGRT